MVFPISCLYCRYTDETSEWTLDYPPLFAWFEWILSKAAVLIDPRMVDISSLNYAGPACIAFQVMQYSSQHVIHSAIPATLHIITSELL